jgi:hypothetical protein
MSRGRTADAALGLGLGASSGAAVALQLARERSLALTLAALLQRRIAQARLGRADRVRVLPDLPAQRQCAEWYLRNRSLHHPNHVNCHTQLDCSCRQALVAEQTDHKLHGHHKVGRWAPAALYYATHPGKPSTRQKGNRMLL